MLFTHIKVVHNRAIISITIPHGQTETQAVRKNFLLCSYTLPSHPPLTPRTVPTGKQLVLALAAVQTADGGSASLSVHSEGNQ